MKKVIINNNKNNKKEITKMTREDYENNKNINQKFIELDTLNTKLSKRISNFKDFQNTLNFELLLHTDNEIMKEVWDYALNLFLKKQNNLEKEIKNL